MRLRLISILGVALAVAVLDAQTQRGLALWLVQVAVVWSACSWASRREFVAVALWCAVCVLAGLGLSPGKIVPCGLR